MLKLARISALALLATMLGSPTHAIEGGAGDCAHALNREWKERISQSPISEANQVVVISLDDPAFEDLDGNAVRFPNGQSRSREGAGGYRHAILALKRSFPSFVESDSSGILTGCCAVPLFGTISHSDLRRLSHDRFRALCRIGDQIESLHAGVSVMDRAAYATNDFADPYFSIAWWREPRP